MPRKNFKSKKRGRGTHMVTRRTGIFHKPAIRAVSYTFRSKVDLGSRASGAGSVSTNILELFPTAPFPGSSTVDQTAYLYHLKQQVGCMFRFDWTRFLSIQESIIGDFTALKIKKSVYGLRRVDSANGISYIAATSVLSGSGVPIAAIDRPARLWVHYLWMPLDESSLTANIEYDYITQNPRSRRVELRSGSRISWSFHPQVYMKQHYTAMNRSCGPLSTEPTPSNWDFTIPTKARRLGWIPCRMLFPPNDVEASSAAPWMLTPGDGGFVGLGHLSRLVSRTLLIAFEYAQPAEYTISTVGPPAANMQVVTDARMLLQADQFCTVRLKKLEQVPYSNTDVMVCLPQTFPLASTAGFEWTEATRRAGCVSVAMADSAYVGPGDVDIDLVTNQATTEPETALPPA